MSKMDTLNWKGSGKNISYGTYQKFSILINIIDAKHIQDVKKVAELISSTKRNISDWYLQKKITTIGKGSGRG